MRNEGPSPSAPENVTVTETSDGIILSWAASKKASVATAYFTVDYCYDDQWRRLSKTELKPHESSFKGTRAREKTKPSKDTHYSDLQ